jgi:hypothetical protein
MALLIDCLNLPMLFLVCSFHFIIFSFQDDVGRKAKREYRKRKHKMPSQPSTHPASISLPPYSELELQADAYSSDEEVLSPPHSVSDHETDDDPDGVYGFKRKSGVFYHAPILREGVWGGVTDSTNAFAPEDYLHYHLTSINQPRRCVGFIRRRVGRGGRLVALFYLVTLSSSSLSAYAIWNVQCCDHC